MSDSWITLRTPELTAKIDPLGAQLSSLQDAAGNELLWQGDAAVWAGRAPILFPIVGTLAGGGYLHDGTRYALSRHGFARGRRFDVVATTPVAATFRLSSDEATLAVYPFRFELEVSFALAGAQLDVTATVRNTGAADLPASLGFHPGFRWPLSSRQARDWHTIEFEQDEPAPVRRITADGLLSPQQHPTPVVNRRLLLDDSLFRDDVIIFDALRSRSLTYGAAQGPVLRIGFPDARYLGLWTKPGAQFICIEPWRGVTDPVGFNDEFAHKPGVFRVAPGAQSALHMTISVSGTSPGASRS